jgi:hypothetical protein
VGHLGGSQGAPRLYSGGFEGGWGGDGHSSVPSHLHCTACLSTPSCLPCFEQVHPSLPKLCFSPPFLCLPADKREEFDEPSFALIDTLFSLAEAHLFMQASTGHSMPSIHSMLMALSVRVHGLGTGSVILCAASEPLPSSTCSWLR